MGPLTKGRYWEIIAVPDIRDQAAAVADDIQRELEAMTDDHGDPDDGDLVEAAPPATFPGRSPKRLGR